MRLLILTLAAGLDAAPILAQEIASDQRMALDARVAALDAAMTDNDAQDSLPLPRSCCEPLWPGCRA
jgi:hypothetical protein